MSKLNILPGDKVKFKLSNMKDDCGDKIYKLTRNLYDEGSADYFLARFNKVKNDPIKLDQVEIWVDKIANTSKTNTEYANVVIKFPNYSKIRVLIQTRYLRVCWRKTNHPLTNIFGEFWDSRLSK